MNQRDMVAVTRERFAKEMKAVKEVLATKAADGTYTYECEAGLTFEKLTPDVGGYYTNFGSSDYDTALDVYEYINDGSGCTIYSNCGGKSCEGYSKEIPFDESKAYAIFLKEATYDAYGRNPTTEAELINPDCKIQMGCDVPAYDRCARDHYYSCKLKDGETWNPGQNDRTKIQSDCATKAACIAETVKCDKLKMPAKTDSGGDPPPTIPETPQPAAEDSGGDPPPTIPETPQPTAEEIAKQATAANGDHPHEEADHPHSHTHWWAIVLIIILFLILVVYIVWQVRLQIADKEKEEGVDHTIMVGVANPV